MALDMLFALLYPVTKQYSLTLAKGGDAVQLGRQQP